MVISYLHIGWDSFKIQLTERKDILKALLFIISLKVFVLFCVIFFMKEYIVVYSLRFLELEIEIKRKLYFVYLPNEIGNLHIMNNFTKQDCSK